MKGDVGERGVLEEGMDMGDNKFTRRVEEGADRDGKEQQEQLLGDGARDHHAGRTIIHPRRDASRDGRHGVDQVHHVPRAHGQQQIEQVAWCCGHGCDQAQHDAHRCGGGEARKGAPHEACTINVVFPAGLGRTAVSGDTLVPA
eukprot:5578777-Prymnesium_polylepis.2